MLNRQLIFKSYIVQFILKQLFILLIFELEFKTSFSVSN